MKSSVERKCIYCLEYKVPSMFNREHVIPESMGLFESNLILYCVCKECNSYFGGTIDATLGRGSLDALLRHQHNLKPLSKLNELDKQLSFTATAGMGAWAGAMLKPYEFDSKIATKPKSQIGFLNKTTGNYEYFLPNHLPDFSKRTDLNKDNFQLFASDDDELNKLAENLPLEVHNPEIHGALPDSQHEVITGDVTFQVVIDTRIKRAFAKIGFNYFACVAQARGLESLIYSDKLDPVRSYIRYENGSAFDPVEVTTEPMLAIDTPQLRHTVSHLLALDWHKLNTGQIDLEVSVSLFNSVTYRIVLVPNYTDRPLPDIFSGHEFDHTVFPRQCRELITI